MQTLRTSLRPWYQKLITPRSRTPDEQRRELILNILLCGLMIISLLADMSTISNHLQGNAVGRSDSLPPLLAFSCIIAILWWLSRKGLYKLGTYVLLSLVLIYATQLLLTWSFELPEAELTFGMLIVIAGVLLTARAALVVTFIIVGYVGLLSYAQVYSSLHPNTGWLNQRLELADSAGYLATLLIIGLVSWLANREIDRSLGRARASEAALEVERDSLEIKVVERTRALEQAQLQRVMELQRLAEFGRMSAGLLHDVANPLTIASLNLEQLGNQSQSLLVRRALQSLHHIERFLDSARKQLKSQGSVTNFVAQSEIKQVLAILNHRAREANVKLELLPALRRQLYGDPVKFNQIIANLVLNAIEAYDEETAPVKRRVVIELKAQAKGLKLIVRDWGRGLSAEQHEQIFAPFYSTKPEGQKNMGIGLATVRQIVETDFKGRITTSCSPRQGTRFTVCLYDQPRVKP
ncbi:MAG TPA: HAMP domain-containing sensor histidine kinase [Verrucomicrobiae bacterium]|nr:HAMP domain-containing sensor histidine kinase [Verrucomicrobiae bacterium]